MQKLFVRKLLLVTLLAVFSLNACSKPDNHGFFYDYLHHRLYEPHKADTHKSDIYEVRDRLTEQGINFRELNVNYKPVETDPLGSYIKALYIPVYENSLFVVNKTKRNGKIRIFFHGNSGGIGSYLSSVKIALERGFSVVMLSYPGYSGNPNVPNKENILSATTALINKLEQIRIPERKIYIHGHSLGSAIALHTVLELAKEGDTVQEVLLHAPFTSVQDMTVKHYKYLIPKPVIAALIPDLWNNEKALRELELELDKRKLSLPLIKFFHGNKDALIPMSQSQTLRDLAEELGFPTRYIELEGYDHNESLQEHTYS